MFFFFFSSRRRHTRLQGDHTRLQGDWSSDVCSSDLIPSPPKTVRKIPCSPLPARPPGNLSRPFSKTAVRVRLCAIWCAASLNCTGTNQKLRARSEERRVGKECSARGASHP